MMLCKEYWPKEPNWPHVVEINEGQKKSLSIDYCFVYDFTEQTSLYLFKTKVSHQSAVSISHHTILYLKQAIWIPVATFPPTPKQLRNGFEILGFNKNWDAPKIRMGGWKKVCLKPFVQLLGMGEKDLWFFWPLHENKIKTFYLACREISCDNNLI